MMRNRPYFIFLAIMVMMLTLTTARAQNPVFGNDTKPEDREVDMDNPTFVPMVKVGKVLHRKRLLQILKKLPNCSLSLLIFLYQKNQKYCRW